MALAQSTIKTMSYVENPSIETSATTAHVDNDHRTPEIEPMKLTREGSQAWV